MNEVAQQCLQASMAYADKGMTQESLLLLERAMLACPEDADIVARYVEGVEAAVAVDDDSLPERLEALEGFVRSRILHVAIDRIDDVTRRAETLRARREAHTTAAPQPKEGDDANADRIAEVLTAARNDGPVAEPPAQAEDLARHVHVLESTRELVEGDLKALATISSALERAQLAQLFDVLEIQARETMVSAASWKNASRAACALQHVDGALRPVVAMSDKLDPRRVAAVEGLLVDLKNAATRLATASHEAEAAERWNAFLAENPPRWMADVATPSGNAPDGDCQRLVEKARALHEQLFELLPSLRGSKVLEAARAYSADIVRVGSRAAQAQQKRYDTWALQQIRGGYKDAKAFIGVIDDEKKLGNVLVSRFGGIDVRFLGHEVQRCYAEVFDLLYEHLDGPKGADDFDVCGSKLNALSRMLATAKLTPSDF